MQGRSGTGYADWLKEQGVEVTVSIEYAALDPFRRYRNAIRDELPDTVAVLDAFHVVKLGGNVWGSKTWFLLLTYGVIGVSGCGFVLVDEAVEDSSSSDPVGRKIGWRRLEWLGWPTVQGPVGRC